MTKLYSNDKPKNQKNKFGPKEETIQFLLQYSRALKIKNHKGIECELLLN